MIILKWHYRANLLLNPFERLIIIKQLSANILNTKARFIRKSCLGRPRLVCQSTLTCGGQIQNGGRFEYTKGKLLSLLAKKLNYFYLTKSGTSQITILLNESIIEELTGWLSEKTERGDRSCRKAAKENINVARFVFTLHLLLFLLCCTTENLSTGLSEN